ncbi:MAG: hypothetical protein ACP5SJ_03440 [Candidatus Micrarchaeia archaeon]
MVFKSTEPKVGTVDAPAPPFYLVSLEPPISYYTRRGKDGYLFVTGDNAEIRCSWYHKSGGYITLEVGHRDAENRYAQECIIEVDACGYISYKGKNAFFSFSLPESEDKRIYPMLEGGNSFKDSKGVLGLVEARLEQFAQPPDPHDGSISLLNASSTNNTLYPGSAEWKSLYGLIQKAFEEIKDTINTELSRYAAVIEEVKKERIKKINDDWKRNTINPSDWSISDFKTLQPYLPAPNVITTPLTDCIFDNIPLEWKVEQNKSIKTAECPICDTSYFFDQTRHSSGRLSINVPWIPGTLLYGDKKPDHDSHLIFSDSIKKDKKIISYEGHIRTDRSG